MAGAGPLDGTGPAPAKVRATSFGSVAADYERFRPPPPEAAAQWLLPDGARRVAEIAAGTGKLTRLLTARAGHVVAVELDPRMASVLAAHIPGAAVLCGRGEQIPLATGVFDAVVISSAWHWLDPARAVPEIARVLRPGGVLGVVSNSPDRSVGWVGEVLRRPRPAGEQAAATSAGQGRRHGPELPEGAPFEPPALHTIEWSLPRTPAELVGLSATYSRVITLPEPERAELLARAQALIGGNPETAGRASVDLPMTCRCWRAVRL